MNNNLTQPLSSLITPKEVRPKKIVARRKKDRITILKELLDFLKESFPKLSIKSWSGYGYTKYYEHRIYVNNYGHFWIKDDLSFESRFEMCQDGEIQTEIKEAIMGFGLTVIG